MSSTAGEAVFFFLVAIVDTVNEVRKPDNHKVRTKEFDKSAGTEMPGIKDDKGKDDATNATKKPDKAIGGIVNGTDGN